MINEIKISVIVSAYNVGEWIARCIESIIAQSHKNIELILIDDGSTDSTAATIDAYAEQDQRIIAIHQKNVGLVAVRERGISLATGDYIGFVDGDDYIEPDMYERLLNNALQYNAQISQCAIQVCYSNGRKVPECGTGLLTVYDRIEGCHALLNSKEMETSLCNKLYQASLLNNSCIDPTVINNEDLLRNIVLFERVERSVREDFCGYHYWSRTGSMSN